MQYNEFLLNKFTFFAIFISFFVFFLFFERFIKHICCIRFEDSKSFSKKVTYILYFFSFLMYNCNKGSYYGKNYRICKSKGWGW